MLGAITGDIIGSVYEFRNIKTKVFPLFSEESEFTDDTILTVAIADAIIKGIPYCDSIREWCSRYPSPKGGYGSHFLQWLHSRNPEPYYSMGNGSAMRVSPIAYAFGKNEMLTEARKSAKITHNHPEGIKGAQAVCLAISLALGKWSKHEIQRNIEIRFDYNLHRSMNSIRPEYQFNETCPGSVPEAIICFLQSESFEDAIRNAISIGGDSDTIAAITGSIAEAFYGGIPKEIEEKTLSYLPMDMIDVIIRFNKIKKDNHDRTKTH